MSLDSLISEKKEEIKKLRRDKKLAYLRDYYLRVTKPSKKRAKELAKQGLSENNGNTFHHAYLTESGEITVQRAKRSKTNP